VLNARVTLASLRMQDLNLLSFAESGQTVVAEIAELLMRFEQTMDDILKAVDQTQVMVAQIDATMRTEVLNAFGALMRDLAGFDHGIRAVSSRGAELSRKLQSLIDATSRAVSGLQVGDSTRQQLDHIAAILSRSEAADPLLVGLVKALLQAASQTHASMLGQLQTSVNQMTAGLSDLVNGHLSGFFGTPLVERRQGRGTLLTTFGERLVWAGQRLQARLGPQLQNLAQELESEINALLP
jgi:hypothetical protein